MNHLIDSYSLFFVFFFSMYLLVGVVSARRQRHGSDALKQGVSCPKVQNQLPQ